MQATNLDLSPMGAGRLARNLGYFMVAPITALVILSLVLAFTVATYQSRHKDRIYTGVSVGGVDLSRMNLAEAEQALPNAFPYSQEQTIVFSDPASERQWLKAPADLGLAFDVARSVDAAFAVGRQGNPIVQFRDMFESWYYGRPLAPILVFDEGQLDKALAEVASEVNQPAVDALLYYDGNTAAYAPSQVGHVLDVADARARLLAPITDFRPARLELLVHDVEPAIHDDPAVANQIQQLIGSPINFYLQEPLADLDLQPVVLPPAEFVTWLRVEVITQAGGAMQHKVFTDENAVRQWLSQFAPQLGRPPVNARYYFDDDTRELVLVAPHINGRELDIEATTARFMEQVNTPNRSIPFIVKDIVPVVHSGAKAAELGITELISEKTTWFYGSSAARKHNIARSAANFYGIVIAPGEEFSFNKYLGTVSEADGYEEGLIIVGGRTIKGIGGGVCQVSTTLYQTAFWAGFPMTERWAHGYMVGYYNDGEGPGMDATVFSPIVDLKFINNTPHHLLIENYYSEENQALTFKFYSTSLGRTVEKSGPEFANPVPAPPVEEDIWEFDEDVPPGTVQQIDWTTEGADVTVRRLVKNANGETLIDEIISSHYIPYPNSYHYGPGVEPYDYSLLPPED